MQHSGRLDMHRLLRSAGQSGERRRPDESVRMLTISNDNPFSESAFKTLKYAPAFPDAFGCRLTPAPSARRSSPTTTTTTGTPVSRLDTFRDADSRPMA